jgi:hypothetical protein
MKKFVEDYKYIHIPFCTQCCKHSEFTATTTNQIRGAITMDNPAGFDPTFVANKQTTKLICNTCGQQMGYLKDRIAGERDEYTIEFYSDHELQLLANPPESSIRDSRQVGIVCLAIGLIPLYFFWGKHEVGAIIWAVLAGGFGLLCLWSADHGFEDAIKELEKRATTNGRIKIGTSPNNETVVFHQKTGEITYE